MNQPMASAPVGEHSKSLYQPVYLIPYQVALLDEPLLGMSRCRAGPWLPRTMTSSTTTRRILPSPKIYSSRPSETATSGSALLC